MSLVSASDIYNSALQQNSLVIVLYSAALDKAVACASQPVLVLTQNTVVVVVVVV